MPFTIHLFFIYLFIHFHIFLSYNFSVFMIPKIYFGVYSYFCSNSMKTCCKTIASTFSLTHTSQKCQCIRPPITTLKLIIDAIFEKLAPPIQKYCLSVNHICVQFFLNRSVFRFDFIKSPKIDFGNICLSWVQCSTAPTSGPIFIKFEILVRVGHISGLLDKNVI